MFKRILEENECFIVRCDFWAAYVCFLFDEYSKMKKKKHTQTKRILFVVFNSKKIESKLFLKRVRNFITKFICECKFSKMVFITLLRAFFEQSVSIKKGIISAMGVGVLYQCLRWSRIDLKNRTG